MSIDTAKSERADTRSPRQFISAIISRRFPRLSVADEVKRAVVEADIRINGFTMQTFNERFVLHLQNNF